MTTATPTLTDFLLARIAEDEAAAKMREVERIVGPNDYAALDIGAEVLALVVAPERVLAECEAKRRIVESQREADETAGGEMRDIGRAEGLEDACRMLAAAYADHPDCREEWKQGSADVCWVNEDCIAGHHMDEIECRFPSWTEQRQ